MLGGVTTCHALLWLQGWLGQGYFYAFCHVLYSHHTLILLTRVPDSMYLRLLQQILYVSLLPVDSSAASPCCLRPALEGTVVEKSFGFLLTPI